MMCTMQTHITQALSNPGDVIKPMFVINEMRRKYCLQSFVSIYQLIGLNGLTDKRYTPGVLQ